MKINRIELFSVKIPLAKNKPGFFSEHPYFTPSWIPGFRQSEMRFYLLRLTTDSGLEGFSAMPAMSTERYGLGPILGSYLLGIDPMNIGLVNQRIQEFSYVGMRNGWIEAAFWDIIGKVKGEPLYKILGGQGGYVYPYASTGSTYDHDQNKIREVAKRHRDDGFLGVKLRVKSSEMAPMVDFVGAARDAVGKEMDIMVDANQGWPVDLLDETPKWDVDFAIRFARSIEEFDVRWLEEPLNKGNFEGLAKLRKETKTPIAGGEINSTWREFKAMLDIGCLDIYQPDAIMAGGTYGGGISVVYWLLKEIYKDTENKLKFCPHTWTTGLGFALALQMVGVLKEQDRGLIEYPLEGNWRQEYWARFLKNDFTPDAEGRIKIPDGPGLGIEVDMNIIRRFGKRIYNGTPSNVARFTLFDRGLKQALYLKNKKKEQEKRLGNAEFKIPEAPF